MYFITLRPLLPKHKKKKQEEEKEKKINYFGLHCQNHFCLVFIAENISQTLIA